MQWFSSVLMEEARGFSSSTSSPSLDLTLCALPALVTPKLEPLDEEEEERSNPSRSSQVPLATGGCNGEEGEVDPVPLRQLLPSPKEEDLLSRFYGQNYFFTPAAEGGCAVTTTSAEGIGSRDSSDVGRNSSWTMLPTQTDGMGSSGLAALIVPSKRKPLPPRSAEMVRVSTLNERDQQYFRNLVRRTRATYEALRILLLVDGVRREVSKCRADLVAATAMTARGLSLNRDKRIIGSIPGIHVGDIFFFRMELCVVGLHGQTQAGIDSVAASRTPNGEPIATSIVVSGGYEDDEDTGNVIIYTGHGGKIRHNLKHSVNQKLQSGNLALERSMNYGIEIRVIRGFKFVGSPSGKIYVYDGLYQIVDFWQDVGKSGFSVYKYKLVRVAGQDEMGSSMLKTAQEMKLQLMGDTLPKSYLSHDISTGKEKYPVSLFNDIDDDSYPIHFEYLARPLFPKFVYEKRTDASGGGGCMCTSDCLENCSCAVKNGGEFAYDYSGILLTGKPLIYECGNLCQCPPTCRNRVSQRGVRNRLELFRSMETGWGVRSLDLIRAGAFVCEYSGIVLTPEQADILSMNGDNLIRPNRFPNRWFEWGDLSGVVPDYSRQLCPPMPISFAIDVSKTRNVACYLSHSSSPNVFVQFVLYDHYDVSYPHLMIFALENIPPMKELSIDYGVHDAVEETLVTKPSP